MPYNRRTTAHKQPSITRSTPCVGKTDSSKTSNMASQTEEADPEIQYTDHFTALMQAIGTCQTTLTGKIDKIQLEMGLIRKDMDSFRTQLTKVERRVGDTEDVLGEHTSSLRTLTTKVKALE